MTTANEQRLERIENARRGEAMTTKAASMLYALRVYRNETARQDGRENTVSKIVGVSLETARVIAASFDAEGYFTLISHEDEGKE